MTMVTLFFHEGKMKLDKLKSKMQALGLSGTAAGLLFSSTPAHAACWFTCSTCSEQCSSACVTCNQGGSNTKPPDTDKPPTGVEN